MHGVVELCGYYTYQEHSGLVPMYLRTLYQYRATHPHASAIRDQSEKKGSCRSSLKNMFGKLRGRFKASGLGFRVFRVLGSGASR